MSLPRRRLLIGLLASAGWASGLTRAGAATVEPGSPLHRAMIATITPAIEWSIGTPVRFAAVEIRRIDDWAHLRAVVRHGDGGKVDPAAVLMHSQLPDPVTASSVLRLRDGRWMALDARLDQDQPDRDDDRRRWRVPAGLLPARPHGADD